MVYSIRLDDVLPGESIIDLVIDSFNREGVKLEDKDIVLIPVEVISRSLGLLIKLNSIRPKKKSFAIASKTGLDPRFVELVYRECDEVVAAIPYKKLLEKELMSIDGLKTSSRDPLLLDGAPQTLLITIKNRMLYTNAGARLIDSKRKIYALVPEDIDELAKKISMDISNRIGKRIAVVVCDKEFTPWGLVNVARGCYGVKPLIEKTVDGTNSTRSIENIVFSLCSLTSIALENSLGLVLVRGLEYEWSNEVLRDHIVSAEKIIEIIKEIVSATKKVLGIRYVFKLLLN